MNFHEEFPIYFREAPGTTLEDVEHLEELHPMVPRRAVSDSAGQRALRWSALAVRLVLAGLFLRAGWLKLSDPRAFAHAIDEYGIGALLDRRWGSLLMAAMLALFIGVLWFGILNDLDVDCGCFSLEEQRGQASLKQPSPGTGCCSRAMSGSSSSDRGAEI